MSPRGLAPNASQVQDAQRNLMAHNLARSGNVTLFRAPSHAGFMCTGWLAGAVCFAGALIILNQRLYEQNKELSWIVPVAYRIVVIFLVALSGWSIIRSSRLLSSIEILPGPNKAKLLLRVRRNIPLPFIKPKALIVDTSDLSLGRGVIAAMERSVPDARSSGNLDSGILSRIRKRISISLFRFFAGARQYIFSDGIIQVYVEGYSGAWKLDSKGHFLDGGVPFFHLVKFKD
jgi:hypothetical protein